MDNKEKMNATERSHDEAGDRTDFNQNASTDEDKKKNNGNPESVEKDRKSSENGRKRIVIGVIAAVAAVVILFFATSNLRAYHAAQNNFSDGHYREAMTQFEALDYYKDSKTKAKECAYRIASSDYKKEKFQNALDRFNSIKSYKDATKKIKDCEYQLSPDGSFIRELGKGLNERWARSEKDDAGKRPSLSEGAKCADYCDIELKHIGQFENQTFNDTTLGTEAKNYIEVLRKAKETTQYATIDYTKFITDWTAQYSERSMLIQKFVQNNGLKVAAKYQNYLNELTTSGAGASSQKAAKESIQKMADGFKITAGTDEFGNKTYKMDMTNTTQLTFESFSVEISLLDASGAIKGTGYSGAVNNWTPGQKATVDVYFTDMNVDPAQYKIKYVPRYQSGTMYG